jgi:nitrite reductase/ring-hydroxylating ferredoxin subunit
MRVKFDGCIGEIEEIVGEKLTLSYTDGSNTGWNSECSFKRIELSSGDVEKMDNGLNSAWKICSI